jgi:hypothetical protein
LFVAVLISIVCLAIVIPSINPASAVSEVAIWTKVDIPTQGEPGHWVLTTRSDIQHLIAGGDGTLYAYVKGPTYTMYCSVDGGYRGDRLRTARRYRYRYG